MSFDWFACARALLVAGLATFLLAKAAARTGLVDASGASERKLQRRPVPKAGGLALACGLAAGLPATLETPLLAPRFAAAAFASALACGLTDDLVRGGLRPAAKAALQLVASVPFALGVARGEAALAAELPTALVLALALAGAVLAKNLANTFDNADGALALLGFAGSAVAGTPAAGALAGFLPLNLDAPRGETPGKGTPTAYLGDGGSHLIALVLLAHPVAWPLFLIPGLDLARLALVRSARGSRPWIGDRRHLAHRLQRAGWGPRAVAGALLALALPAAVGGRSGGAPALWGGVLASTLLYAWALRATARSEAAAGLPPR
jgi:UDP-N-acetylmuramyl pentapeptide phosphotransferase/UDP-N-acetylglucosamine-1-phosphate transferase